MPRIGEKTEMFTTIPVKKGVGGWKFESKGVSKTRGTGMFEALPTSSIAFFPFQKRLLLLF